MKFGIRDRAAFLTDESHNTFSLSTENICIFKISPYRTDPDSRQIVDIFLSTISMHGNYGSSG